MDDMNVASSIKLHYRPDGDNWLTAFSSDLRETGMSQVESSSSATWSIASSK